MSVASSRAFANKEREAQSQRMGRWARAALLMLATSLFFVTLAAVMVDQLYRPDTFVIEQLKIRGKFRHLQPSDIEKLVVDHGTGNFFSVELAAIKSKVEAMPWVQAAEVRREWPNTLLVSVSEHRPVMRWNKNKWVSSSGIVIDLPGDIDVPNPIRLFGREQDSKLMLQHAVHWKKRLASSGLELKELTLSGSHAWKLSLYAPLADSHFEVLLGREQVEQRLARFQYLFDNEFDTGKQRLQRVDARYPDGLAIKASEINPTNNTVAVELSRGDTGNGESR